MNPTGDRQLNQRQIDDLYDRITLKINREQKKADLTRTIFYAGIFGLSLAALIPSFNLLKADAAASGFWEYFSLVFSDSAIIAKYWQNFSLSLLEVLPAMSLAAFLAVIFALLESLKCLAKDYSVGRIGFKIKMNQ